jgi:hypothetical protein
VRVLVHFQKHLKFARGVTGLFLINNEASICHAELVSVPNKFREDPETSSG